MEILSVKEKILSLQRRLCELVAPLFFVFRPSKNPKQKLETNLFFSFQQLFKKGIFY